ncbi:MAG: hypothetical protein ACOYOS_00235 [Syntrophales bacterium]
MNIDDLLGKLIPLFEQKMAFNMEKEKRVMSLAEKTEERKLDLEYRKLESQIASDKDKMKWEKEKLTTTIKGGYDLEVAKNSGALDVKRLEGIDAKEKQKIMEEGANSRAKLSADTETNKAFLTTLGTILGHAQEISQTGLDGQTKTSKPTAEVGNAARSLMEKTGLAKPTETPQARNVAGEAEFAASVLREHEKNGTPDQARNYLNALPTDTRQAALTLLNPGAAAAPMSKQEDAAPPIPAARPPVSPVQPAEQPVTSGVEPARPIVQPIAAAPAPIKEKSFAAAAPLGGDGKTAFGGTPGGFLGKVWERGQMQAAQIVEQRKGDADAAASAAAFTSALSAEEEKNRALRRARGVNVGGRF